MSKFLMSLLIIGAVFIFVLGGGAGVLYQNQTQKAASQFQKVEVEDKAEDMQSALKGLSSKVIISTVAYGQITKIEGKNIILSRNGDNITVRVRDDAEVYSIVADGEGRNKRQDVDFKALKIGDNLNITIKLLPDGQIEGQSVIMSPAPAIIKD